VLYQLPPRWRPNAERLAAFVAALPADPGQVVEFRDRRWYRPEILDVLRAGGVALCLHDMEGSAPELVPTGPCVYVRLHGAGRRYGGRYPEGAIETWAERIAGWSGEGRSVWAYFNNDAEGHAVTDAVRLREAVARRTWPGERLPAERHANCIGPPT
jgi:uncharacterized protein YecE (DUF72 family)